LNSPVSIRRPGEGISDDEDEVDGLDMTHLNNLQRFIKIISNEIMKLFVEVKRRNT
jgi:hypothetical protein